MNTKPVVVKIRKLSLAPSDILLLSVPLAAGQAQVADISAAIHRQFPDLKFMVLPDTVKPTIVSQE